MNETDASKTGVFQIAASLTLLAAYAVAAALPLTAFPLDLFLVGAVGLYLTARWQIRGCCYALILLALVGIAGHLFLEARHFLRLGLEASFACSFFAAALAFDAEALSAVNLHSKLASRAAAIQNLEDEIGKIRESQVEAQIASAKKIEELLKNYDEIAAEKSSLDILNDVLRKANAAHFDEKIALENQMAEGARRLDQMQHALGERQTELNRLRAADFAVENQSLLRELNKARFDKEQTRQINETLVRLHANESIRAKEAADRLQALEGERETLQEEIRQLTAELAKGLRYQEIEKIEDLKRERAEMQGHLAAAEEKVRDLAKVGFLYKQLKDQFEEKNRILHEARSALFKVETELQTVLIEKEEQSSLLPETLRDEFSRLDFELGALQKENLQLQDLVTYLTEKMSEPASFAANRTPLPAGQPSLEETLREALTPKRKKKTKKIAQQDLLF